MTEKMIWTREPQKYSIGTDRIEITTMPHLDKTAVMRVDKKTKEEKTELPDFITVLDKFS